MKGLEFKSRTEITLIIEETTNGRWSVRTQCGEAARDSFGFYLIDLIASDLERFVPGYSKTREARDFLETLERFNAESLGERR